MTNNNQPEDYISLTDLMAEHPDLREKCRCQDTTLVTWGKRYEVDGYPLGVKVGGEFRISPTLLREFLKGRGQPIMRG